MINENTLYDGRIIHNTLVHFKIAMFFEVFNHPSHVFQIILKCAHGQIQNSNNVP